MTVQPNVDHAVIIPAYDPGPSLVEVVRALTEKGVPAIVLIDDGSGPAYRDRFEHAASFHHVYLLRHDLNRGKGAALKTGIRFAMEHFPHLTGIVTADADGQHHPDDIERIIAVLLKSDGASLLLGARAFQGDVPLRSRFGNMLTSKAVHLLLGRNFIDTQTGLRGIPARMLPQLLQLRSNRYDFELEMLILAHRQAAAIIEEPIRTIYEQGNQCSHFHPLIDSAKIYLLLLRFARPSLYNV